MKRKDTQPPATKADLKDLRDLLEQKFAAIDERFESIGERFDGIDKMLSLIGPQFDTVLRHIEVRRNELTAHIDRKCGELNESLHPMTRDIADQDKKFGSALVNHEERLQAVEHHLGFPAKAA